jgi:hypothetical protein
LQQIGSTQGTDFFEIKMYHQLARHTVSSKELLKLVFPPWFLSTLRGCPPSHSLDTGMDFRGTGWRTTQFPRVSELEMKEKLYSTLMTKICTIFFTV